jgi:hypothetical protein
MRVTGLENFGLTETSFRHLGTRKVYATVHLRTYEVTFDVRRLPPSRRHSYLAARVNRWIKGLRLNYPRITFRARGGESIPQSLDVCCSPRDILNLAAETAVKFVYLTRVDGHRRRPSRASQLTWYCVRALIVIRVERVTAGLQTTEDRLILVRASSCKDAKKRLMQQWQEYESPYLNSDGQMVSWSLDNVMDVYDTGQSEIDPAGTEVYSKLGQRRMRPEYVWRPKSR